MGLRVLKAAPLAAALLLAVSGAAHAQLSDYSSHSEVDPDSGSSVVDDSTSSSSAAFDANNYARSFITPGTSIMGASAATDGTARPTTWTTHQDSWWFECNSANVCGEAPISDPIPLQVNIGLNVSETQVAQYAYLEFDASYQLDIGGQFNFSFVQDGQGDFELSSTYVDSLGDVVQLPVQQTLTDGVWHLSVNSTVQDQICGLTSSQVCIPEAMSCPSSDSCGAPVFTDQEAIKAEIDPGAPGETDVIDGYDPFNIKITSLDPNYEFVSADGRIIPGSATPEPATWAMMILGFGAIGAAARRRSTNALEA